MMMNCNMWINIQLQMIRKAIKKNRIITVNIKKRDPILVIINKFQIIIKWNKLTKNLITKINDYS